MSFALNTKLVFIVPRQMFARFTMPIKIEPQEEKVIIYKDISNIYYSNALDFNRNKI